LKEFIIVGLGSFLGGAMRYAVSKLLSAVVSSPFPLATFAVNIIGCLVIGFVSALPFGGAVTPQTKLFLTTGFCGGFTTFSTFMNESGALVKDGNYLTFILYIMGSLAVGIAAVAVGHWLGKAMT
jgi:fluoride exporter